jgi:serine/threonine-protein kinase SRPK3
LFIDVDDDHITQIIELLGSFPKSMTQTGKFAQEIFNRKGELRHIHKLRFWPLVDVLYEKYRFGRKESKEISDFISLMCVASPGKRRTAGEMLQEGWIGGSSDCEMDC